MEIPELIEKLADKLGTTSSLIVSEYTGWFIANSLVSIAFGVALAVFAFMWKPKERRDDDAISIGIKYVFKVILMIVGCVFVANHVPNLAQPKAKAIHQLLRDIRGS